MTVSAPLARPVENPALGKASLAVIALLFVSGAIAAACCRSLYADGSFQLLFMLTTGDITRFWPSRLFADYLMDYPVVAALDLGVRSLRALAILFTASLLYIPLLAYSAAIWIVRDDRLLWIATLVILALCYFPTSFFLIGEFHLLYALFWLGFVLLLTCRADRRLGSGWGLLTADRELRPQRRTVSGARRPVRVARLAVTDDRRAKLLLTVAVGLLLIAAWSGLQGVVTPADPASKADFLRHAKEVLRSSLLRDELWLVALAIAAAFAPWWWLSIALMPFRSVGGPSARLSITNGSPLVPCTICAARRFCCSWRLG
jgi:hypothetical protein